MGVGEGLEMAEGEVQTEDSGDDQQTLAVFHRNRPGGVHEQFRIVAGLYPRIHVPALPQLPTLTSYVEEWTNDFAALPRSAPIPRH